MGLGSRRNTSAQGGSRNAVLGNGAPERGIYGGHLEDSTTTPPRQPESTTNQNLSLSPPQYTASRRMVAPDSHMSMAEQHGSYADLLYSDSVHVTSTTEERTSQGSASNRLQSSLQRIPSAENSSPTPTVNFPVNTQAYSATLQGTLIPAPPPPLSGDMDSTNADQAASVGPEDKGKLEILNAMQSLLWADTSF